MYLSSLSLDSINKYNTNLPYLFNTSNSDQY